MDANQGAPFLADAMRQQKRTGVAGRDLAAQVSSEEARGGEKQNCRAAERLPAPHPDVRCRHLLS